MKRRRQLLTNENLMNFAMKATRWEEKIIFFEVNKLYFRHCCIFVLSLLPEALLTCLTSKQKFTDFLDRSTVTYFMS